MGVGGMSGSWSCERCSTVNRPADATCMLCGAPRARVPMATVDRAVGPAPTVASVPRVGGVLPPASPTPLPAPGSDGGQRRTMAIAVACTVLAVVAVVGLLVAVARPFDHDEPTTRASGVGLEDPPPRTEPDDDATTSIERTSSVERTTTTARPTTLATTTTLDPGLQATFDLQDLRGQERSRIDTVVEDYWVPQLGSKRQGLEADGIVYDDRAILDDYRSRAAEYSDESVALLWSGDYASFKDPTWWVTIVVEPFSTPGEANAWCDRHGIDAENCFAKLISHTPGIEHTTESRK